MTTTAVAVEAPAPLLRDRRFLRFWTGQTVSQFGDRISELALPLTAVGVLHASTAEVALLTALIWTPNLGAILLGAWVERRRNKRRLLVLANLLSALALSSLPIAHLFGSVTIGQLYAVAVTVGAAGVLFSTSYSPFFANLVPRSSYIDANSKLSTTLSASYIVGPAVGGLLVAALTAPVAVSADALSFLAAALLIGGITVHEPDPLGQQAQKAEQAPILTRAAQGIRLVARDPILRAGLGCSTTVNFFTFVANGLIVLFASRTLGLSAGLIGLALGLGATGSLLGALTAPRLSRLLGVGRTIALGAVLFPAPIAIAAVAAGPLWLRAGALAAAEFVAGVGVMLFDINLNSLQTSVIPDGMRSRVSGAYSTVNYGSRPLGALTGGLLGTVLGVRTALLLAAVGGALSVLWLLASPVPGIRTLDTDTDTGGEVN